MAAWGDQAAGQILRVRERARLLAHGACESESLGYMGEGADSVSFSFCCKGLMERCMGVQKKTVCHGFGKGSARTVEMGQKRFRRARFRAPSSVRDCFLALNDIQVSCLAISEFLSPYSLSLVRAELIEFSLLRQYSRKSILPVSDFSCVPK